ncbi:MAG: hypothetical protein KME42_08535 [Tildeniella nuda ZEHNDER 1965/U140]|jgi:hypothetical protein|nr:hypothetical protein [Tildeniella nuda ZEHNDER 1965/U140]
MSTTLNEVSTLDAAYFEYIKDFPKKAVQLRTAIFHYLLPYKGFGFDFEVKRGELLSAQKTEMAWGFARQVKLDDLWEIDRVLTWQAEVFESLNAPRTTCRPNKHYLSHFLVWCKEQGYLKPKPQETWEIPQSLPGTSTAYHRRGGRERQLVLNRQLPVEYRAKAALFSDQTKLSLEKFTAFWTDPDYEGLRPISTIDVSSQTELLKYLRGLIGWFSLDKLDYHRQMRERARKRKALVV